MCLTESAYWARKWDGIESIGSFARHKEDRSWDALRPTSMRTSGEALGELCDVFNRVDSLKNEISQALSSGELNVEQVSRELHYLQYRLLDTAKYFESAADRIEQQKSEHQKAADNFRRLLSRK
ncbi:MAG: hypothetical protein EB101_11855 [Chitinophagia bacterium]|nr:hypothetical protein [Chitinophagia bacterium]